MKLYLIHRSIFRETIYPFFMVLLILTFVLLMGRMLQLVDLMVNKGVDPLAMLRLILYLVPSFLIITIPVALLIAILISMGRLSRENEILVMKSSGLSLYQLAPPVALLAVAAFSVTLLLGLVVVPAGNAAGRDLLVDLARQRAGIGIKEKIFNDDFPGIMLYADRVSVDGSTMKGVFISDHRMARNPVTIIASRGRLIADPGSMDVTLRLEAGSTHMAETETGTYRKMDFSVYDVALDMSQAVVRAGNEYRRDGGEMMTVPRMLRELGDHSRSAADRNVLVMELNKRFAMPMTCIVFALMAFPLGMVKHRTAKSRGFVIGLVIVTVYYVLQLGGDAFGETGRLPPPVAAWAPNVILGTVGLWLFGRALAERPPLDPLGMLRSMFRRTGEDVNRKFPRLDGQGGAANVTKGTRRTFTAEYKRRILKEAESLRGTGGIGAFLKREGLTSSHLHAWRRQEKRGALSATPSGGTEPDA